MAESASDLLSALRQRMIALANEAATLPEVAQGHLLLVKDAGVGSGTITSEQARDVNDHGRALGKAEGARWILTNLKGLIDEWEENNL